jgi:hypothetical protein
MVGSNNKKAKEHKSLPKQSEWNEPIKRGFESIELLLSPPLGRLYYTNNHIQKDHK